jgi:hypothetical protein
MTIPDAAAGSAQVYLLNATQVSTGETGPGYTTPLPWAEAKALVDAGYAVFGIHPPLGVEGTHGPARQP